MEIVGVQYFMMMLNQFIKLYTITHAVGKKVVHYIFVKTVISLLVDGKIIVQSNYSKSAHFSL